ncbi:MAG: hypothetical protein R3211_06375 [Balneolaceae bacterium]|nr:hypothetical protein [Balneolaceae bacterium]
MKIDLTRIQEDSTATVDTLTQSYSQKWDALEGIDQASPLMQTLASNDLIFIVLGVSLIIWFVLLFFIIRVDKKVGRLEEQLEQHETK